jgi:DNA-binding response OmpR family regulator
MRTSRHIPSSFAQAEPLVLLVEDNVDSREMYAASLEWSGFRVTSAGDGATALAQALSLGPQIVVTDLHVPGLNGPELCLRLKMTESTARIPVIAVTVAGHDSDLDVARAAGFDRVLVKPYLPDELRDTINDLLARSARARRTSVEAAARATRLRTRTSSLALQSRVVQCRTAAMTGGEATPLPCPDCRSPLAWRDTQTVAGIQFDYFAACLNGCGQYYFDHQRRRFMRLR